MNHSISTYNRTIRSSIAEQILSNCKIYVDLNTLRPHFIGNSVSKNSDLYRYMKNASQCGGFISTEYHSKDITTARMFTSKNHLNLITLSDPKILSAIKSRYKDGIIVVLDYKAYEPSIIKSILGDCFPVDIHTWAEILLGLERSKAKKMNMLLLYCDSFENKSIQCCQELIDLGVEKDICLTYISKFIDIRNEINVFTSECEKVYNKSGYIVNTFGRKIYIKESRNIFSNMVQSIGSEILIESIININKLSKNENFHILFHRFDSLYFDFSKQSFLKNIKNVIEIMECSGGDIQLKVGIQLGNSLNSLKDFIID